MKKRMLSIIVLVSASHEAGAAVACNAGTFSQIPGSTTAFVKTGFTPKCSANVELHYLDGGSDFAIQAASSKGKTVYGGTTAGGGVVVCTTAASGAPSVVRPSSATNPC